MEIRKTHDAKLIALLNRTVHDLHLKMYPDVFKAYDENAMVGFFEDMMEKDQHLFLVAEVDFSVVGYIWLEFKSTPETLIKKATSSLYVHQLSLEKAYQNMGYGTQLMAHIEQLAAEKGLPRIELDYWVSNENASAFYSRCGFVKQREFVYKEILDKK